MLRIEDIEEFDYRVKQCGLQDRSCDTFQRIIAALKVRRSMIAAWSSRGSRVHDRRRRIAITQVSGVRGADMRGMRVTLFVAVLATIVEISRAESTRQSLQCKNIARDVFINSCKGPRMKRSPQKSDTSNADQIVKATISGWI